MGFRFELIHHPQVSADFQQSKSYFAEIDEDLAQFFQADFQAALRGIATGREKGLLFAKGQTIRWVKLARFSHKVFFEHASSSKCFILGLISGRRHPTRIRLMLSRRRSK
jgi:hypothetical protein